MEARLVSTWQRIMVLAQCWDLDFRTDPESLGGKEKKGPLRKNPTITSQVWVAKHHRYELQNTPPPEYNGPLPWQPCSGEGEIHGSLWYHWTELFWIITNSWDLTTQLCAKARVGLISRAEACAIWQWVQWLHGPILVISPVPELTGGKGPLRTAVEWGV